MNYFLISYTGIVLNNAEISIEKTFDCTVFMENIFPSRKDLIDYIVSNSKVKLYSDELSINHINRISEQEYQLWNDYTDEEMKNHK